jgi:hypothetical protein
VQPYIHTLCHTYIFILGKKVPFWTLGVKIELL